MKTNAFLHYGKVYASFTLPLPFPWICHVLYITKLIKHPLSNLSLVPGGPVVILNAVITSPIIDVIQFVDFLMQSGSQWSTFKSGGFGCEIIYWRFLEYSFPL